MKTNDYFTTCNRCKRTYHSISVAHCRHPTINQYIGKHICMYCCAKCKHHIKNNNPHSISCGYIGGDNHE